MDGITGTRQVARRGREWGIRLRRWRLLAQLLVVAYVAGQIGAHALAGTPAGAEALCPFGGFESAWSWITTGRALSHTHLSNLVLAGALVVMALAAPGFFCGWLCPLGSIQEWVHRAAGAVVSRVPVARRARRRPVPGWLRRVDRVARYGRYAVLAWAVGGAALAGVMVFRDVDPWEAVLTVTEIELGTGLVVLVVTLMLSTVIERPWCRYACPLGAVQGLVGKLSPVRVERDSASCLGCDLCTRACPMGVSVHTATRVRDSSCIGCLECVAACPSEPALGVTLTLPVPRVPVVPLSVGSER